MKALLIGFFLFLTSLALGWGETAVFREVTGKVEYQIQSKGWLPATMGVEIPSGTTISTGFRSSAAVEVLGSVVFLKPLTRLVLDGLVRSLKGTKTYLTLLAGKVKAEVKPSSASAFTTFHVKGAAATALVKGTGFEFDGVNLLVNHGEVLFMNRAQIGRYIQGGEISSVGRGPSVTAPIPIKPADRPLITAGGGLEEVDALFQEPMARMVPTPEVDLATGITVLSDPRTVSSAAPQDGIQTAIDAAQTAQAAAPSISVVIQ